MYAKARFYDPEVGRFLEQDSYLGDATRVPSLHRYFYANQNPLIYIDPDGRQSLAEVARRTKEERKQTEAEWELGGYGLGHNVEAHRPDSPTAQANRAPTGPRSEEQKEANRRQGAQSGLEQTLAAVRSSAPHATIIKEQDQLVNLVNDPAFTAYVYGRRDTLEAFRTFGAVGTFVGETYVVVAAGTANDVKVLATGTDLNGRDANRWIAAGAITLVGVSVSDMQILSRVDDELRVGAQERRAASRIDDELRAGSEGSSASRSISSSSHSASSTRNVSSSVSQESSDLASSVNSGVAQPPNRIYSARELNRRAEDVRRTTGRPGPFHNFPQTFDDKIYQQGTRTVTPNFFKNAKAGLSNDSVQYTMRGSVNGVEGTFEIFVRPSVSGRTEVVIHRFFRPD